MNEIWRTGKFPEDWHKAVIIPIPKPGKDKTEATNYRPIALTKNYSTNDHLVRLESFIRDAFINIF